MPRAPAAGTTASNTPSLLRRIIGCSAPVATTRSSTDCAAGWNARTTVAPVSSRCGPRTANGSRCCPAATAARASSRVGEGPTAMVDGSYRLSSSVAQPPSCPRAPLRKRSTSGAAGSSFLDCRLPDVIELRELRLQVRVSLRLNAGLIRLLAVLSVDLFHDVHARGDFAKRGEALTVESRIVLEVDEHLRGAGVGTGGGKGDVAGLVALFDRIVRQVRSSPHR